MGLIENILRKAGYYKAQTLSRPIPRHLVATAEAEKWTIPDYQLYANQVSLYAKLSWINAAVRLVSQTAAAAPLNVMQYSEEKEADIISHPFEDRLKRPNPLQSRSEFLEASFSSYIMTGNCYWWINMVGGSIAELWVLPSKYIKPVPDENMYIRGYAYKPAGYAEPIPIEVRNIVHFKTWNPYNEFVGLSLMESIAIAAEGDMAMQYQNARTYKEEGGRLPSVLSFADQIGDVEWEKIKRDVRQHEAERRMMLLRGTGTGQMQWIQNSMSNRDMEYLESRTFTKEEIWSVIAPGMSSMLAVNATEANSKTGKATFAEYAIYPRHVAFSEKITNDLLPLYGDNLVCEFEDVRISDKILEIQEQTEYAKTHTIDEIRERYYGDKPIGDERGVLLPAQVSSITPRELVDEPMNIEPNQTPAPEREKEVDGGGFDENEDRQQERESAAGYGEEIKAWERKAVNRIKAQKALDFDFIANEIPERVQNIIKSALAECKSADDVREVFSCKALTSQRDPDEPRKGEKENLEDKISKIMLRYWRRQNALVKQRLERMFPHAVKADISLDVDILDSDDELEQLQAALMRLLVYAATDAVDLFSEFIQFDIDYTMTNAEAASWATRYAGELIRGIDETTLETLRKAVSDFVDTPGMTIADVMARLPYTERRARMIAVTEITRSYAEGQRIAGDALAESFPGVPVVKTWWTNRDDRVCPVCGPLHGQTVDINNSFSSGAIKPPVHPGCRCWITYSTRLA